MLDAEPVEEAAHHRALVGEVIDDERAAGDLIGHRREAREVLRLAVDVEADHRLRPEFLLLRDEERRLHLIVDGIVVAPEGVRGPGALIGGHALPETGRCERRVGHYLLF